MEYWFGVNKLLQLFLVWEAPYFSFDFKWKPFKSLSVSTAFSPWPTELLLLFTTGCYLGSFLALVLQAGQPSFWFQTPYFSGGTPWILKYPPSTSAAACRSQLVLSYLLCTLYQSCCAECFLLSIHGYKASLQLVFSWLFKMISLLLSCNSRLVLGGQCSFHLLFCYLGFSSNRLELNEIN